VRLTGFAADRPILADGHIDGLLTGDGEAFDGLACF
jgi:hypothetical protein